MDCIETDPALQAFADMVSRHDLTYMHSDDHNAWARGQRSFDAIRRAAEALPPGEAARIWNAYVRAAARNSACEAQVLAQFGWRENAGATRNEERRPPKAPCTSCGRREGDYRDGQCEYCALDDNDNYCGGY